KEVPIAWRGNQFKKLEPLICKGITGGFGREPNAKMRNLSSAVYSGVGSKSTSRKQAFCAAHLGFRSPRLVVSRCFDQSIFVQFLVKGHPADAEFGGRTQAVVSMFGQRLGDRQDFHLLLAFGQRHAIRETKLRRIRSVSRRLAGRRRCCSSLGVSLSDA